MTTIHPPLVWQLDLEMLMITGGGGGVDVYVLVAAPVGGVGVLVGVGVQVLVGKGVGVMNAWGVGVGVGELVGVFVEVMVGIMVAVNGGKIGGGTHSNVNTPQEQRKANPAGVVPSGPNMARMAVTFPVKPPICKVCTPVPLNIYTFPPEPPKATLLLLNPATEYRVSLVGIPSAPLALIFVKTGGVVAFSLFEKYTAPLLPTA